MSKQRPQYGIDAPGIVIFMLIMGILISIALFFSYRVWNISWAGKAFVILFALSGLQFIVSGILMIYSSKIGKPRLLQKIVDSYSFSGKESILDCGCGSGMLLIALAKKVPQGEAIGIDIWNKKDQSQSSIERAKLNAQLENVDIRLETQDMTSIPFSDQTFDLVSACLSINNIHEPEERAQVLSEMVRVLKPKGDILIIDFQYTKEYAHILRAMGLEVILSPLNFERFPPVRILKAKKN